MTPVVLLGVLVFLGTGFVDDALVHSVAVDKIRSDFI